MNHRTDPQRHTPTACAVPAPVGTAAAVHDGPVSDTALRIEAREWRPSTDLCCPNPARIRDYLLGGNHTYALERTWCGKQLQIMPSLRRVCHDEGAFLLRAVHYALHEHGIDRFLVIGGGLPSAGAVHDLVIPHESGRVVYADDDMSVILHLERLALEYPQVSCVRGSFVFPGSILFAEATKQLMACGRPVCLVLCGVLDAIADTEQLTATLQDYTTRLPAGSLVVATHATVDGLDPAAPPDRALAEQMRRVCQAYAGQHRPPRHLRTAEELQRTLGGLDLIDPGLTFTAGWRNCRWASTARPAESLCLAVVAAVPGAPSPRTLPVSGAASRCRR